MQRKFLKLFLVIGIALCCCTNYFGLAGDPLRFCAVTRRSAKNDILVRQCARLAEATDQLRCIIVEDRLSCLRLMLNNRADFAVFEPEDLTVAAFNGNDGILVTHELKTNAEDAPQYDTEMMLLAKNFHDVDWNPRDKRLCYPGLDTSSFRKNYHYHYTSYFERWNVPKSCHSNMTILENRIFDLAAYFESACIAGPWSLDSVLDGKLKSKYKSLCSLCYDPVGCYEGDRYYGDEGAISCLLDNYGDAAWVTKTTAVSRFSDLSTYGFNVLCPDGSFHVLAENQTCSWIVEPRPVVAARKDIAQDVASTITDMGSTGKTFYPVIHASYIFSHLRNETLLLNPETYLNRYQGYFSSNIHTTCDPSREVRWCVASNEEAIKCEWVQMAAAALDIQPRISCIQQKNRQAALEAVKDGRCRIFVTRQEEEMAAKKMKLKPLVHIISNKDLEASRVGAIVRKDSRFNTYADLKGTKACFTGYRSVGWNSMVSIIRSMPGKFSCSDSGAISEFFSESCVYGLSQKNHSDLPKNIFSLCNRTGEFDTGLGPEENAFKCLMNGGDVAFVNISAAKAYYSGFSIFRTNYKVLCDDNNVGGDSCFMAETTLGSVMMNSNSSDVLEEETYLLLLSLDRFLGQMFDRETAMLSMYGPFDGHSDVIFPDATHRLQKHINNVRHGKTYEEILESLQENVACQNSGANYIPVFHSLYIVILMITIKTILF